MPVTPIPEVTGRVPLACRVPEALKNRLQAKADHACQTPSTTAAELLQFAVDLDDLLQPFHPALHRLMTEDHLTRAEAVAYLLSMDVQEPPLP